jgi:hypothetical protein
MRRSILAALLAFAAGAAVAAGCQKEDERPAYLETRCEAGVQCHDIPPPSGSGGSSGSSGEGGNLDAPGDATTSVTGTVALLTAEDFENAVVYPDPATITLDTDGADPVDASYDGTSFSASGVRVGPDLWATVAPSAGDAMPTLQPLDTTTGDPLALLVVPRSTLELVHGLLTVPTAPADGTAQVVLQFFDAATLAPLEGVSVSHGAEAVAYDSGATYSDSETATGPRGFAILVNVPAVQIASTQKVQVTANGTVGVVEVLMQSNAVTLADVFIAP